MSDPLDEPTDDRQDDPEEPEAPRLSALIEALARGDAIDWQQAESTAESAEEKERIRALAAISEVATFHRTWLAEAGLTGDLDEDDEPDDEIPARWGELEILERVGRGSFGDVYKAREPRLDRIVALKLIRASARTPEREAETLREGRLLAKVRHPNVATVYGTAGADGRVGFWMEFLEGKNLAEILEEKGRFEPREAAQIGVSLCRALGAVHARGIVHRDVKAQNVVRENDGRIVLTDFGVGRDAALLETEAPSLSGTPLYLAPELFEGKRPSPASDLYALGVLLFYLVTGEFPITGTSFDELRDAHRGRKRRWLKELRKDLPGTFVAAVERTLDRDPEKRGDEVGMERELGRFLGERLGRKRKFQQVAAMAVIFLLASAATLALIQRIATLRNLRHADQLRAETKMEEAVDELIEAKLRTPGVPGIYWRLMSYSSANGNYVLAFDAADQGKGICEGSRSWNCHMVRAWASLLTLDYKGAVDSFEAAVKMVDSSDVQFQIALAQINLGHPEFALDAAKSSVQSDAYTEAATFATTLSAVNRHQDAMKEFAVLKKRFPRENDLHWTAGTLLIAAGQMSKAEAEFQTFADNAEDAGDSSTGRLLLAQALMFQSKFDEAKRILVGGSSLDREEGFSRNEGYRSIWLAKCHVATGDFKEAIRSLRLVEKQPTIPANLKLFRNAALVAFDAGNIEQALKFSKIVSDLAAEYESDLGQSFVLQLRGEFAMRKGDFDEAADLLDGARKLRDDPQNSLSMANLGMAEGRCDRVKQYVEDVVKKRAIIVGDFQTPWVIWNEAVELKEQCSKSDSSAGGTRLPD